MPQLQSLINNREGRRSILVGEESKQIDKISLKKLEKWIFSTDGLKIGMDLKEQIELQENLKSFFCDFKRMVKNCANLKKTIKAIFSIITTLDLEESIQKIIKEACDSLLCERVIILYFNRRRNYFRQVYFL